MKETGGTSKYLILGMLSHTELTGYGIRKWIEAEYSHFWQASFGQIYPLLRELTREGLAAYAAQAPLANGRGQKAYRITDAGLKALGAWLLEEPEVEKLRYEILLKISFGEHTNPEVLLTHLRRFTERNEAALREMDGYIARFDRAGTKPEADHGYSRLTALCGKYHYAAMRDWALEAIDTIRKEVDSK